MSPAKRAASEAIHVMVTPADRERYGQLAKALGISMRELVVMGLEQVWNGRTAAEATETAAGEGIHAHVQLLHKHWLQQAVRIARLETDLHDLRNEITNKPRKLT